MRYYSLSVSNPDTGEIIGKWESHPNGVFDPQAQNIIFDIPIAGYGSPTGAQTITIEGISLTDLQQAKSFAGLQFSLKAGMAQGLPLANPLQQGTIAEGVIFQSFGNWEGTEMTLDFVCYPTYYNFGNPTNIILNWKQGQLLSDALTQTFATALPNIPLEINISPSLVLTNDEIGFYPNFEGLAQHLKDVTKAQGHPVIIAYQAGKIMIADDTYNPPSIPVNFNDLVGQSTWIDVETMQVKTIMRGDITITSQINMPQGITNSPGFIITQPISLQNVMSGGLISVSQLAQAKNQSTFQNSFNVTEMRHLGNYRSPDGAQWVTIMNAVQNLNGVQNG